MALMPLFFDDPLLEPVKAEIRKNPVFALQIQKLIDADELCMAVAVNEGVVTHFTDKAVEAFYAAKGV